jgi:hypothetical protein
MPFRPATEVAGQVVGQGGMFPEGPVRSQGALRTTPGFAIVAATTSGLSVSFATP